MITRSRQNNGYAWLSESKRSGLYVPSVFIPFLKQIAQKLDAASITEASKVTIIETENKIVIEISKN